MRSPNIVRIIFNFILTSALDSFLAWTFSFPPTQAVWGAQQQQSLAADPGDPLILRRYERWRKGDNLLTMGMLDLLHQLFGGAWVPAARLGGLGLGIVNRLAPVKRRLALHAIGRSGDLPAVARGC